MHGLLAIGGLMSRYPKPISLCFLYLWGKTLMPIECPFFHQYLFTNPSYIYSVVRALLL